VEEKESCTIYFGSWIVCVNKIDPEEDAMLTFSRAFIENIFYLKRLRSTFTPFHLEKSFTQFVNRITIGETALPIGALREPRDAGVVSVRVIL